VPAYRYHVVDVFTTVALEDHPLNAVAVAEATLTLP
jgi:hypothetical protein